MPCAWFCPAAFSCRSNVPTAAAVLSGQDRDRHGSRPTPDKDVLKLLVQGKPNKLICRDLSLSEGTIKVHVSAILRALNVHNRTQVVIELARRGVRLETSVARAR